MQGIKRIYVALSPYVITIPKSSHIQPAVILPETFAYTSSLVAGLFLFKLHHRSVRPKSTTTLYVHQSEVAIYRGSSNSIQLGRVPGLMYIMFNGSKSVLPTWITIIAAYSPGIIDVMASVRWFHVRPILEITYPWCIVIIYTLILFDMRRTLFDYVFLNNIC